jgi:hypothetical protein
MHRSFWVPVGSGRWEAVRSDISPAHQGEGTAKDGREADRVDERKDHVAEAAGLSDNLNVKNC